MRNKILGVISFFFSGIILYVFLRGVVGNFLIPSMQRYLMIAGGFLLLVGISLLFSKEKEKFVLSDFLLLLPIFFLLCMGDGKLTTDFANNRSNTFQGNVVKKKEKVEEKEIVIAEKEDTLVEDSNYDFKNVDFEVKNTTFAGLSDGITYNRNPERLVGKTIRVRGFAITKADYLSEGVIAIGKYLISCCAADAEVTGFFAVGNHLSDIKENSWYEIEGVLELGEDPYGNTVLVIHVYHFKEISSKTESLYVYPCYSYGDGSCKEVLKYNLNG